VRKEGRSIWDARLKGTGVDPADTVEIDRLGGSGAVSKAVCKFRRKVRGGEPRRVHAKVSRDARNLHRQESASHLKCVDHAEQ